MNKIENCAHEQCIYTIVSTDVINDAFRNGGIGVFLENTSWHNARAILSEVIAEEGIYLLLIANASANIGVEWIALIEDIELLTDGRTRVSFSSLHSLPQAQKLSTLQVLATGKPLNDDFIGPFVLCVPPEFAQVDTTMLMESDGLTDMEQEEVVACFKTALQSIELKITEGQRKMLIGHYEAPSMTLSVTKLAGYKGAAPGKLHYGKLARKISEATGINPPTDDQISIIGSWTSDKDERGQGQWVLYDEVALALEELGWVKRKGL